MAETAVITGATSGIGREFAIALADRGYDLVLGGRRKELLHDIGARLSGLVTVRLVLGDLTDDQVAGRLIEESRRCRFLVNNAGYGHPGLLGELSESDAANMMTVHNSVPVRLARAALETMSRGGGAIVNVGSLAGRMPVPGGTLYAATKVFLERLSESLALEYARSGVVVQALTPGFVTTDFHRYQKMEPSSRRSRFIWSDPEQVVRTSLRRVDAAMRRLSRRPGRPPLPRHVVVIPTRFYRFASGIATLLPRRLVYSATVARARSQRE